MEENNDINGLKADIDVDDIVINVLNNKTCKVFSINAKESSNPLHSSAVLEFGLVDLQDGSEYFVHEWEMKRVEQ